MSEDIFSVNPEDPWLGDHIISAVARWDDAVFTAGQAKPYVWGAIGRLCCPFQDTACFGVGPHALNRSVFTLGTWTRSDREWPSEDLGPPDLGPKPVRAEGRFRLRKRGRATAALAQLGRSVRGWWRDLTCNTDAELALLWMQKYSAPGVKLGSVRSVPCSAEAEVQASVSVVEVLFSSEESTRPLWVCPELVASLFTVRCFRHVGPDVLASLRSRACLWARDRGVSDLDFSLFLPGTLVFASLPQPGEVVALGGLRSDAARWSSQVLAPLAAGQAVARSPWDIPWSRALRIIFFGEEEGNPLRAVRSALALSSK
uniref:Uncharacterized protein n=1 Tax=Macrophomina phaseolina umbra-like virus 1 TaxID=2741665 RepID=A0A7S6HWD8_9TOMB|nr:hypothetical protein [Macrophomina phaseolina umbra-like virus 1]